MAVLKTRFHHNVVLPPFILLVLMLFTTNTTAELDSTTISFMDSLEMVLRSDYRHCTNDTSDISIKELLVWRESIDSITARPDYPIIAKKYYLETGMPPASVRPCEIIQWIHNCEAQLQQSSAVLAEAAAQRRMEHDDSLYLATQLSGVTRAPYDFNNIPFGISRRAFMLLVKTNKFPQPVDQGNLIRFDSLRYGELPFKVAFHFSKDDRYYCYEIESRSCSSDSLDLWARPTMLYMATQFEIKLSVPPDHLYRIGHLDIVPGRLAICKMWIFPDANAYFGLARTANRFYAKAIIQRME